MAIFDINAAPYNAVGDYTTDDTAAIQSAINDAAAQGGRLEAHFGRYRTSSALVIPDGLSFVGDGYPDDSGAAYTGSVVFNPNRKGTNIYPGAHDAFQITSKAAVHMEGFQIAYNQSNGQSGLGLVAIRSLVSGGINTRSVFRDIDINLADYGIAFDNFLEFLAENVNILHGWNGGMMVNSPVYPSWGDSKIKACHMWGHGAQTNNNYKFHIGLFSGGGFSIEDTTLRSGDGVGGSGILINPNQSVDETMEPISILGCSIEGQAVGVNIVNNTPDHSAISELSIIGGNIWSGINAFRVNTNGTKKWLNGFSINDVPMMVNGGPGKTICVIDNAQQGIISGNQMSLSGGGTGTGFVLGANTTGVSVQSNKYIPGLTPVVNAGTGNTIGGGSA